MYGTYYDVGLIFWERERRGQFHVIEYNCHSHRHTVTGILYVHVHIAFIYIHCTYFCKMS